MSKYIHLRIENQTAFLTLNRPEKHNAFNSALLKELSNMLDELNKDKKIRLLILAGRGKSFSSGVDLDALLSLKSIEEAKEFAYLLEETSEKIYKFSKPVIARLHGLALGGAAGFASAADIRIATPGTKIGFPAVKLGAILPATCTIYVESLIGRNNLLDLTLTGRIIEAKEASDMGLINEIVSEENIDNRINEWARQILEGSVEAIKLTKQTVNFPYTVLLEQAKLYAVDNFAYLSQTKAWQERMKNFSSKK